MEERTNSCTYFDSEAFGEIFH